MTFKILNKQRDDIMLLIREKPNFTHEQYNLIRLEVRGPSYHLGPKVLNKIIEAQIPHCQAGSPQAGGSQVVSYMPTITRLVQK